METLNLFQFAELPTNEAKIKALRKCASHTAEVVDKYVNEIYPDHIGELEDVFGIDTHVTVNNGIVETKVMLPESLADICVPSVVENLLNQWSDCISNGQNYFYYTDELKTAIANYSNESASTFIRRFIASLDYTMTDWALRTKTMPEYALKCIGDQNICECVSVDLIPEDVLFDANGNIVRIE